VYGYVCFAGKQRRAVVPSLGNSIDAYTAVLYRVYFAV